MSWKRTFIVFTAALIALIALPLCFAQTESATISGRVTDSSGAFVRGVSVSLTSAERGTIQKSTTNDAGIYVFPAVHPGIYHIMVSHQGFQQVSYPNLVANVQDHIEQNFTLKVGSTSESVTVNGDAVRLNSENASVSTVVDSQFVENMPLNGRSFQSLIEMTPGVIVDTTNSGSGQFVVNGQRSDTNYFTVDGVSANVSGISTGGTLPGLTAAGGTNGLVSVDAMQEFRIQTSSYAPEYGRTPGAQIGIVTKSGSNQWHGTVFDYFRNGVFDARNYFDFAQPEFGNAALPKPDTHQNDFGGTISGPIWKNRTFFFFSYEGLRAGVPAIYGPSDYYTASAKAAVANSPTAGLWKAVVAATPTGTGQLSDPTCDNINNPCTAELSAAQTNRQNLDSYSLRIDHNLTKNMVLFARYSHAPSSNTVYDFNTVNPASTNTDSLTVGLLYTITPKLVNDFRFNWSRQETQSSYSVTSGYGAVLPSLSTVIPTGLNTGSFQVAYVAAAGDYTGVTPTWGTQAVQTQRQLNFVDTLSKVWGTHQLKFGVDYRRMQPTQLAYPEIGPSAYSWSSVLTGISDDTYNSTSDVITGHVNNWSLFAQDTWKMMPRFTLTYGLRWDINPAPVSDTTGEPLYNVEGIFNSEPVALGPAGKLWNTQLSAFAPRIGAAFQFNSKTVLRGGIGLFYDLGAGPNGPGFIGGNFPYRREADFFGVPLDFSYQDPPPPAGTGLYAYQPLPFTTTIGPETFALLSVNPNFRLPLTYQWNVAFERQLGARQTLTATYVGAHAKDLEFGPYLYPSNPAAAVEALYNRGGSTYNSLQVEFQQNMSHRLQALVGYTYSRSFDNASGQTNTLGFPATLSQVELSPMTPSNFDIPQKFSAAISYNIPSIAEGGTAVEKITQGWALDGLYRYQCCQPITVEIGAISPAVGFTELIAAPVSGQPVWISDPTQPAGKALNPAAFTVLPDSSSDIGQRNSVRSPYGLNQVDLALRRQFNLTERVKLDARMEFFNLLNHPMFASSSSPYSYWGFCSTPTSCSASSLFGKVENGVTTNVSGNSVAGAQRQGQSSLYGAGGPRSAQLTVRLTF